LLCVNGKPFDRTRACTQATNQLRKHLDLAHRLTSKLTAKPGENREQQETPGDKMAEHKKRQSAQQATR
jgi:hypothetical protein